METRINNSVANFTAMKSEDTQFESLNEQKKHSHYKSQSHISKTTKSDKYINNKYKTSSQLPVKQLLTQSSIANIPYKQQQENKYFQEMDLGSTNHSC